MIVTKENLEKKFVSFYKNVKADKYSDLQIGRVLRGIKNGAYYTQIGQARHFLLQNEEGKYKEIKNQLPAITFCGTFAKGHKADECETYNNLLVIDIDKLSDMQLGEIRKILQSDPYIASYWMSPSGIGYKALVCLNYDSSYSNIIPNKVKHKIAFRQLFTYLFSNYGVALDSSGSDICRLCYMSSDSNLVIKDESTAFEVHAEEIIDNKNKKQNVAIEAVIPHSWNEIYGKATGYTNNGFNRSLLTLILKKLTKKKLSILNSATL